MYWLSLSFEDGHNDDNVVKHRILKCWCNIFASLKTSGLRQMLLIMTNSPLTCSFSFKCWDMCHSRNFENGIVSWILNGRQQLLLYVDNINFWGEDVSSVKRNTQV